MITIRFRRMPSPKGKLAQLPKHATSGAAGADLHANIDEEVTIPPMGRALVPTGLAIELPDASYGAFVFARSGLAVKHGLTLSNSVGVIDSDYRGEVMLPLTSTLSTGTYIENYERVAQLVILPVASCRILRDDTSFLTEDGKECAVRTCGQHREFLGEFILQTNGNVTIMAAEELPVTKRGTNGFGSTGKCPPNAA